MFELLSSHILTLTFKYTPTFLYASQTLKVTNIFVLKYFTVLLLLNNSLTPFIGREFRCSLILTRIFMSSEIPFLFLTLG